MRKSLSVMLITIMLFVLASCGSYKVDGVENALKAYSCPKDNMFGLEQVVLFEDRIVTVFDKKISDNKSEFASLSELENTEVKQGRYICTEHLQEGEIAKRGGCRVMRRIIYFNDGNLKLVYEIFLDVEKKEYIQTYDSSSGKWGKVEEKWSIPSIEDESLLS